MPWIGTLLVNKDVFGIRCLDSHYYSVGLCGSHNHSGCCRNDRSHGYNGRRSDGACGLKIRGAERAGAGSLGSRAWSCQGHLFDQGGDWEGIRVPETAEDVVRVAN